jgi:hypothetical protein
VGIVSTEKAATKTLEFKKTLFALCEIFGHI